MFSIKNARSDPAAYPVVQKQSDTHVGMSVPVRGTNRKVVGKKVADVLPGGFENMDRIDLDRIFH